MPTRVFSEEEKSEIREKLFDVGVPLLQEFGVTHMSIPRITKAAKIGTGTFYRFFSSKEDYLVQLISYQRNKLLNELISSKVLTGKQKITRKEIKAFLKTFADRKKSIYANMTLEDEIKLRNYLKSKGPNLEKETQIIEGILRYVDGRKENIDYAMLANIAKVMVITAQTRDDLHEEGYERTINWMIDSMLGLIFE